MILELGADRLAMAQPVIESPGADAADIDLVDRDPRIAPATRSSRLKTRRAGTKHNSHYRSTIVRCPRRVTDSTSQSIAHGTPGEWRCSVLISPPALDERLKSAAVPFDAANTLTAPFGRE
jgi:hypothetical protein